MTITTAGKLYNIEHHVDCGEKKCEVDIVTLGSVDSKNAKK